jgi:hypothetical protein
MAWRLVFDMVYGSRNRNNVRVGWRCPRIVPVDVARQVNFSKPTARHCFDLSDEYNMSGPQDGQKVPT